jgi:hypothetical protein
MSIKRYIATKDCSITNSYKEGNLYSASLSNDGAADSLQVFSIYNQNGFESSSLYNRKSRILIDFPINDIQTDINNGVISPHSEFHIKLSNVRHADTVPRNFYLVVTPISKSWDEGYGLDQYNFSDSGAANWLSSSSGVTWLVPGGDYLSQSYSYNVPVYFETGVEDLKADISTMVRDMLSGTIQKYGFGIILSSSHELSATTFYNKKFSARTSEYYYSRPWIEARWDDSLKDQRNNSYVSSSLAPSADVLNTLYIYNYIKGTLKNIPSVGNGNIYLSIYSNSYGTGSPLTTVTGGYVSTGVYSATFYTDYTGSKIVYDFWKNQAGNTLYSSSVTMKSFTEDYYDSDDEFKINITNLKSIYNNQEKARFKLNVTSKFWDSNYYLIYTSKKENIVLDNLYYKIERLSDNLNIIDYGTGSVEYTKLSYGPEGNYFDLDMSLFEPNYSYKIKILSKIETIKKEFKEVFKFRVVSTEEDVE